MSEKIHFRDARFLIEVSVDPTMPRDPNVAADELLDWLCSGPEGMPEWIYTVNYTERTMPW